MLKIKRLKKQNNALHLLCLKIESLSTLDLQEAGSLSGGQTIEDAKKGSYFDWLFISGCTAVGALLFSVGRYGYVKSYVMPSLERSYNQKLRLIEALKALRKDMLTYYFPAMREKSSEHVDVCFGFRTWKLLHKLVNNEPPQYLIIDSHSAKALINDPQKISVEMPEVTTDQMKKPVYPLQLSKHAALGACFFAVTSGLSVVLHKGAIKQGSNSSNKNLYWPSFWQCLAFGALAGVGSLIYTKRTAIPLFEKRFQRLQGLFHTVQRIKEDITYFTAQSGRCGTGYPMGAYLACYEAFTGKDANFDMVVRGDLEYNFNGKRIVDLLTGNFIENGAKEIGLKGVLYKKNPIKSPQPINYLAVYTKYALAWAGLGALVSASTRKAYKSFFNASGSLLFSKTDEKIA